MSPLKELDTLIILEKRQDWKVLESQRLESQRTLCTEGVLYPGEDCDEGGPAILFVEN